MSTAASLLEESVPTGIPGVGSVAWGTHLCHFYRSTEELREPLVEFARAGLANGERCLWITSAPLPSQAARTALSAFVPDLAEREASGQISIIDFEDWYTAGGTMETQTVVKQWLDYEQQALADGYTGLRLTGNTTWLQPEGWKDFAAYECCVHTAFHDRRILALCSYSVDRCDADAMLDVQRNHEFALVRQGGLWKAMHNGTQLLAALDQSGPAPHVEHLVRFFHNDHYPADGIAEYLGQAAVGAAAIIAPAPHLAAVRSALLRAGKNPQDVVMYDTAEIMRAARGPGGLIGALSEAVTRVVYSVAQPGQKAYIYGELVDVLSAADDKAAAVALEQVWNDLLQRHDFVLWCGYNLEHFGAGDVDACSAICGCHAEVQLDSLAPQDQQLFARALVGELALRREYENERTRLLRMERQTNQRLAHLQQITSALSESVTPQHVAAVVCGELCAIVGATRAFLSMPDSEGVLRPLASTGISQEQIDRQLIVGADGHVPAAEVYRNGLPLWLANGAEIHARFPELHTEAHAIACFPLRMHGRSLGVVCFGFPTAQAFDATQRALLEDACNQVGLALERARLYDEAERQRARAELAGRAKDQFIAMLGHELRNPLAAIHTAAELLRLPKLNPDMLARTQNILTRQSTHMSKLIDDLLDVSRIVWGKIKLNRAEVDLTALVREVLDDRIEQVQEHDIDLQQQLVETHLWVDGDRVRLVQILDNILANAIKFTPAGGSITVSLESLNNDEALLVVRDTGAGIDPELLPHIYEPFQQASQDLARSTGGLGLGLTMVKGLVDLHDGRLNVESDGPGRGCKVSVQLPLSKDTNRYPSAAGQNSTAMRRILVIEDNRDAADLLCELLRQEGHSVSVAYSGEEALERAQACRPELVLCDLGLPGGMSGYEVAESLRNQFDMGIYLVALTGYAAPEDIERTARVGFNEHITKPVNRVALDAIFTRF